jgi:putative CRISPR-associated protein (TIGR02619 family)
MSRTILCTTGTSVAQGRPEGAAIEKHINERVRSMSQQYGAKSEEFQRRICAEINSLRALRARNSDRVVLVHTDTDDGRACAEAIVRLVEDNFGSKTTMRRVEGLQATDARRFRVEGVKNLLSLLDHLVAEAGTTEVVLNPTGGFKSVVPFVTLFGLFRGLKVVYLFEHSEELIALPSVPLTYDVERMESVLQALHELLDKGSMPEADFWSLARGVSFDDRSLYECFVEELEGKLIPSAFAQLLASEAARAAEVGLSPAAQKDYERSEGFVREQFEFMLERIADPLYRRMHQHAFSGTDLDVLKPGNTSERAAYFLAGAKVRVCRLLRHDEYERVLPGTQRSDFESVSFTPWSRPANRPAPERSDEQRLAQLFDRAEQSEREAEQRLAAQLAAEERAEGLAAQNTQLAAEHAATVEALAAARAELERARSTEETLRRELSSAQAELEGWTQGGMALVQRAATRIAADLRTWVQSRRARA